MIRRAMLVLLILSLSASTQTGCWDRIEVNDIAIVMSTAFDKTKEGKYRASVQVALPGNMGAQKGGGGGTSGEKGFYIDSETGDTIREANDKLQTRMSRRLFFSHRRVLVLGEDLAKDGIREVFDAVARVPENRLTANLVIAKGEGIELLRAQPQFERFSAEAMREIVESETVVGAKLKDVAHELSQVGYDPLIPYMEAVEQKGAEEKVPRKEVQLKGYAQFHNDRMVGLLQNDLMQGVAWLRASFYPYTTTANLKDIGKTTLSIYKGDTRITPRLEQDRVHFDVNIDARAYILEAMSVMDLSIDSNIRKLERHMSEKIKQSIQMAISQVQEKQTDVPGFGMIVSRTYPKQWSEQLRDNWYEELSKAAFDVQVEFKVSRIGMITENISKREEVPERR